MTFSRTGAVALHKVVEWATNKAMESDERHRRSWLNAKDVTMGECAQQIGCRALKGKMRGTPGFAQSGMWLRGVCLSFTSCSAGSS
jgi:hypothetical protein